MLIRIVKMTFKAENTVIFLALFDEIKEKVRHVDGCLHLELMQDLDDANSFSTYSKWRDESALEAYRKSDLFAGVWRKTKALFAKEPIAFSIKSVQVVD